MDLRLRGDDWGVIYKGDGGLFQSVSVNPSEQAKLNYLLLAFFNIRSAFSAVASAFFIASCAITNASSALL